MMHSQSGFGLMSFIGFGAFGLTLGLIGLIVLIIVLLLKGYALWTAARRGEKGWFVALLIVNTFGILELIYLYFIAGKRLPNSSGHGHTHTDHHTHSGHHHQTHTSA